MARKAHRRFCLRSSDLLRRARPPSFSISLTNYTVVLTHAWYDGMADGHLRFAHRSLFLHFFLSPSCTEKREREREREREKGRRKRKDSSLS